MGKLSVSLKALHTVVDRAVLRDIGVSPIDQLLDHLQHAGDLLGGKGMGRGGHDIHPLHVLLALLDIALGNDGRIHAFLDRCLDDLVIHIREIGDIIHIIALVKEIAPHCIKEDHGTRVPDMDEIVDGGPADVHPDFSGLQRHKIFLVLCHRIKNLHSSCILSVPQVPMITHTAWADIPSCLPVNPSRSSVVAFTFT